jgi:lactoylglutathione lyase
MKRGSSDTDVVVVTDSGPRIRSAGMTGCAHPRYSAPINQETGAPMSTFTYDHIHIRSRDPEKTAAYYERMFDAQIIRTPQEGGTRIDMKIGGQDVFIAPVPEKSNVNPPPVTPYQGLDHFGLRVKDIDKVVADLKAKGAEFTMELNSPRPGIKICFIRGPEGVSIEVLERGIK